MRKPASKEILPLAKFVARQDLATGFDDPEGLGKSTPRMQVQLTRKFCLRQNLSPRRFCRSLIVKNGRQRRLASPWACNLATGFDDPEGLGKSTQGSKLASKGAYIDVSDRRMQVQLTRKFCQRQNLSPRATGFDDPEGLGKSTAGSKNRF